jgi:hypothetical protein
MRAPRRRHPINRAVVVPGDGVNLNELAAYAKYVGSSEHKDAPSFAGEPKPRADAAICDRSLGTKQTLMTRWLRAAIRRGFCGAHWEGRFPRYVWFKEGQTVYEGRLVNREAGWYKGYPLNRDEWPQGIEKWDESD